MLRRIFGILLALSAWYCGMSLKRILFLGSVWLFILFLVVPTVFRSCSTLQRHMVFLPYVHWPKLIDFEDPESEGLLGARNFYLQTEKNVQVGVWHILPRNLIHQSQGKDRAWYESQLSGGSPIVIYLHGNTGSRAREHRLHLYEVLQQLNYHVIAFDYRGYADSSPTVPTKTAVVHDAHKVYEHVAGLAGEQAQISFMDTRWEPPSVVSSWLSFAGKTGKMALRGLVSCPEPWSSSPLSTTSMMRSSCIR